MHGVGGKGKLPPVVSPLFSIKAAHWRQRIRGTELGARGKERTARGAALSVSVVGKSRIKKSRIGGRVQSKEKTGISNQEYE
jgi:hypothetical protein